MQYQYEYLYLCSMNYDRIKQQAGHLPAFQIADTINSTLRESANLVVTAPPGAGKSTIDRKSVGRERVC